MKRPRRSSWIMLFSTIFAMGLALFSSSCDDMEYLLFTLAQCPKDYRFNPEKQKKDHREFLQKCADGIYRECSGRGFGSNPPPDLWESVVYFCDAEYQRASQKDCECDQRENNYFGGSGYFREGCLSKKLNCYRRCESKPDVASGSGDASPREECEDNCDSDYQNCMGPDCDKRQMLQDLIDRAEIACAFWVASDLYDDVTQ